MKELFRRTILPVSVFITGACVLIVEVVAVRVLSPHYGNTIFTVSSVISVILVALSIGYYTGGKLADRFPSTRWFFGIILLSGLVLLAFHFIGIIVLPLLSVNLSLTTGPLLSSLILFLIPAMLLGTLSPYAVKLQSIQSPKQGVGSVAGTIFFWSTLGSIVGSLLAGFVLIPHFGINQIFIATGSILFTVGFIPFIIDGTHRKHVIQLLFALLLVSSMTWFTTQQGQKHVVYSKDGMYEKITIYDSTYEGRPTRFFQQDRSGSGAIFLDSDDLTDLVYEYTKYYSLYKIFKPNVQNTLVIGGGAYSIPKALLAELPDTTVDVSEIEPSLFELSKKYFDLEDNSRLHNFTEDGRRLLRDSGKKYDMIFSDVYYSLFSIPAHFTTQEFFMIAKEKLSEDGLLIANLIGDLSRKQPSLILSEIKTFRSVFPNSYFIAVESPNKKESQNIIFVGYNSNKTVDFDTALSPDGHNSIFSSLADKVIDIDRFDLSSYPVLTDNYSPIEYLTAQVLQRTFAEHPTVDGDEILAIVDQQLRYGPRYLSAPGHKKVQEFLIAEMQNLAEKVELQMFDYRGTDEKMHTLTNVIGRFDSNNDRRIILATHYDSKKLADKDLTNKNRPVPGANDSASGVAVLVELARIIANTSSPRVGVDIVFFDGEEGDENQGSDYTHWKPLGSTYFAEHVNEIYKTTEPISALVIDMVCDKDLRFYKEQSSVQYAPAQVETFWNTGKKVDNKVFQDQVKEHIQDDHTPLNEAGIPSFLLIDFEYPHFHTTADTIDKCSSKSLYTVARTVYDYVYSIN